MQRWLASSFRLLFLCVMMAGSGLITWASLDYFDPDVLPPFVIEKFPLRFETLWLAALRVHVASAAVAFPLCLLLMTNGVQRRRVWHRWLGRVTAVLVLLALVPSGIVLSLEAKGGTLGTIGFLVSGAIVACATLLGIRQARRRRMVAHARAMRHVVAQMSVAVSSRAMIIALDGAGMAPEPAYLLALWVPVLASVAVAELVSRPDSFRLFNPLNSLLRIAQ